MTAWTFSPEPRREYHKALRSWLPDGVESCEMRGDKVACRLMQAYRRHYCTPTDASWREFLAARDAFMSGRTTGE